MPSQLTDRIAERGRPPWATNGTENASLASGIGHFREIRRVQMRPAPAPNNPMPPSAFSAASAPATPSACSPSSISAPTSPCPKSSGPLSAICSNPVGRLSQHHLVLRGQLWAVARTVGGRLWRGLGALRLHDSWETIRRKLADWMHETTRLVAVCGERIECRQDSRPDQEAATLAKPERHRARTRRPME